MTSINFKKDEWMSCLKFESVRARCAGRLAAMARRALAVFALAALAAGCVTRADDLVPDKDLMSVPVGAVGHYGAKIGIPDFYLNGRGIRSVSGWGGGGAGACCVLLPREVTKPFMVTVKWTTNRSNVGERREHEATVPVHFAVQPGDGGSGLYVHFLPGHTVELWYASPTPPSTEYPGPEYPRDRPGPDYAPLPNEKPQPSTTTK